MSVSSNNNRIVCNELNKRYGEDHAVNDVNLTIEPGEQLAVIGPSGAGKTTFLHLLGGIEQPDTGTITVNGRPLASYAPGDELSSLVGVMHQQFDLVDELSVINNVLAGQLGRWGFWQSLISLFSPREPETALRALSRVGIADNAREKTSHLSGGQQQRVALARLLVQHPQIILADEPIASVDPARARDLLDTLKSIAREEHLTLIVSLHSVDLALEHFPRIVAMKKGSILYDRPSDKIQTEELNRLYQLDESPNRETAFSEEP
ncbi:MAG: phosphonate ABC transporter ATP-binding protein [bacterium]